MMTKEKLILAAGFGAISLLLNVLLFLAVAYPFEWLWSAVLGPLGVPILEYWRAVGLLLLWRTFKAAGKGFSLSIKFRDT
jgi:hypothetical protein